MTYSGRNALRFQSSSLCGSNSFGETDLDALRFDELKQSFAVSAHVAIDFGQCWEFFAFGLGDIENIDGPESVQRPLTLRSCIFTRLVGAQGHSNAVTVPNNFRRVGCHSQSRTKRHS